MEYVLNQVQQLNPTSVGDVGTGDGRLVRELSIMLPDARIAGVDYSERAIQLARALNPTLDFRCLDITREPVGETFEVLTLIEVFEHIPPDIADTFVSALRPLIRQDGYLLVTVPHENIPVTAKHFQHFSAEKLLAYFDKHFLLEETAFLDKRSPLVKLIRKTLENKYFILVHWGLRNRIYQMYKRFFLVTDERQCGRVFMRFRPRPPQQPDALLKTTSDSEN
jgi:2-polyprenyl-3-methyl-5-hydroxy-6-metoxy-1,4-benzoquinol methylase